MTKIIQKKFQGTVPENKILNTYSVSQTDTYSCNYVNEAVKHKYSSEERVIGKWMGKPLYEKTFVKTVNITSSNTNIITLSTEVPNADKVWIDESSSYMYIANQYLTLNWFNNTSGYIRTWVHKGNNGVVTKGTSLNNVEYNVTLHYTKTTD